MRVCLCVYAAGSFLNLLAGAEVPVRLRAESFGCASSGDHEPAAGLHSHHAGVERPAEGLPGAGEQAAGGQPEDGGSDRELGLLSIPRLVPAGAGCQSTPCTGQTTFGVFLCQIVVFCFLFFSTAMFHWCVYECAHTAMFSIQTHTHTHIVVG